MTDRAAEIIACMEAQRNEAQRKELMRFFKVGPGSYGWGDEFLGLKVPQTRAVVKAARADVTTDDIPALLLSPWHEVRLCGLLLLTGMFERLSTRRFADDAAAMSRRDAIVSLYLQYAHRANNWDLVDLSAPRLLGGWLLLPTALGDKRETIDRLAASGDLWQQRISMVCTWMTTRAGDPSWCLRYAEMHLHHPHDLMHKAVGWMLREMGKRIDMDLLRDFLERHAATMPRTALRYAIEKMSPAERSHWMQAT